MNNQKSVRQHRKKLDSLQSHERESEDFWWATPTRKCKGIKRDLTDYALP